MTTQTLNEAYLCAILTIPLIVCAMAAITLLIDCWFGEMDK